MTENQIENKSRTACGDSCSGAFSGCGKNCIRRHLHAGRCLCQDHYHRVLLGPIA